jgi:hypothetical protein
MDGVDLIPAGVDLDEVKEHGSVQLSVRKSAAFECIATYRAPRLGWEWAKRELLLRHNILYIYELRRDAKPTRQLVCKVSLTDAEVDVTTRGIVEQFGGASLDSISVDNARKWAMSVLNNFQQQLATGFRIRIIDSDGDEHEIESEESDEFDRLAARLMESAAEVCKEDGPQQRTKKKEEHDRRGKWWKRESTSCSSFNNRTEKLSINIELRVEGDVRVLRVTEEGVEPTEKRNTISAMNMVDVEFTMNAVEVLVIDHEGSELLGAFLGGIRLSTATSDDLQHHRIELRIATLQVDNLLEKARFEVFLALHGDKDVHNKALRNSGRQKTPEVGASAHVDGGENKDSSGREHALHALCVVNVAGQGVICFDVLSVRFREILLYADELLLAKFFVLLSNILDGTNQDLWMSKSESHDKFWDQALDENEQITARDGRSDTTEADSSCESEGESAAVQFYFKLLELKNIDALISLRTTLQDEDEDVVTFRRLLHISLPGEDEAPGTTYNAF